MRKEDRALPLEDAAGILERVFDRTGTACKFYTIVKYYDWMRQGFNPLE